MVFAWVVTAELLALVLTLAAAPTDFWASLSLRSLYVQWVALTLAGLLCAGGAALNRLGHVGAGIGAWLLSLLVTFLVFLLSRWLAGDVTRIDWSPLPAHLGISAIVSAVILRYLYEIHRQKERELAEARARTEALQARIRPHFLFNSMNTIAGLTRSDPVLAEQVVQDLSDLYRASLAEGSRGSNLANELELARGYLRIEALRLGERLRVTWDLQEDLPLQAAMPSLLLQPLLENAVYHGIEPALAGGTIEIAGRYRRGLLNISISNTLAEQGTPRKGNRIAQRNVRERIRAHFPGRGDLHIGKVEGRYQVRLVFPLQEQM